LFPHFQEVSVSLKRTLVNSGTGISSAVQAALDAKAAQRPMLLGAQQMSSQSGSPALSAGQWLLDAATDEVITGFYNVPTDWTTYHVDLYWCNAGAGTGDVVWRFDRQALGAGVDFTVTTSVGSETAVTAGAQFAGVITRVATGAADSGVRAFKLRRRATAGGDTLANDASVLAVLLSKAS
jgi:hypothetical protein